MFTLRAYGLLLSDSCTHVLVADELIKGRRITKFPGGGLEYGEGLKDCLIREVREEIGVEAFDVRHFYTTDFFQQSAFHGPPLQVVGVYFTFRVAEPAAIRVVEAPFEGLDGPGDQEVFRWAPLSLPAEAAVSLPIDRHVWNLLQGAG
ncbi:MAG: NUDIX domain-containing protein [Flavobacteriales bacterium]